MKLMKKLGQEAICSEVKTADSFCTRLVGLIGTKHLDDRGVMFPRANSIHTFFMSIPIDVVYLNREMKIVRIDHELKPWRFPLPALKARTVVELPAGLAKRKQLSVGDELYVGD